MLANARRALAGHGVSRRRLRYGITAEVTRLVPSFVTFLVLPRLLGPSRYGQLAALVAVIALVGSLATIGAHIVFVRDTTRTGHAEPSATGRAFTTSILGGAAGVVLLIPISVIVFDRIDVAAIAILVVAELLLGNLLHVYSGLAIAREDQRGLAVFVGVYAVARSIATVGYAISPARGSLVGFAVCSLLALIVASTTSALYVLARGSWSGPLFVAPTRRAVTEGLAVSSTAAVFYVQDGLDTPILVRSGYAVDAGNYASAYRVASLAFAPINALVLIGLPSLVARSGRDDNATRETALRLTLIGVAYGLAVCLMMQVAAPLLPIVLGDGYRTAADILRWLSLLPLLRAVQYFVANLLMVNGMQRSRLFVQFLSAAVSVIAYLVLIPPFSWRGAVAGTYLSELVLAVGLWAIFIRLSAHARDQRKQVSDALAA